MKIVQYHGMPQSVTVSYSLNVATEREIPFTWNVKKWQINSLFYYLS